MICGGSSPASAEAGLSVSVDPDPRTYVDSLPDYEWSCRRTGRHEWVATFRDTRTGQSTHANGTFDVAPCSRRVETSWRGAAESYLQRQRHEDKLIARAYCVDPRTRRRIRRRATWFCGGGWLSDDGETICVAVYRVRRYRVVRFGRVSREWPSKRVSKVMCKPA